MRRFIAILVLCVLPLQWSYAAVAEYCQHEQSPAAQNHVGHHVHKHIDDSHDSKEKKGGLGDLDCPACHHSTGAAILHVPAKTMPHVSVEPVFFHFQRIPHRSPDNPFRPPLAIRL